MEIIWKQIKINKNNQYLEYEKKALNHQKTM